MNPSQSFAKGAWCKRGFRSHTLQEFLGHGGSYGVIPMYSGLSGRKSAKQELIC